MTTLDCVNTTTLMLTCIVYVFVFGLSIDSLTNEESPFSYHGSQTVFFAMNNWFIESLQFFMTTYATTYPNSLF